MLLRSRIGRLGTAGCCGTAGKPDWSSCISLERRLASRNCTSPSPATRIASRSTARTRAGSRSSRRILPSGSMSSASTEREGSSERQDLCRTASSPCAPGGRDGPGKFFCSRRLIPSRNRQPNGVVLTRGNASSRCPRNRKKSIGCS